jgi:hypothetical protein
MSGFPPTGVHCANLAIARVHHRRCAALAALPALTIVDLACGAGLTLRALAPHLPALQTGNLSTTTSTRCCMPPMRSGVTTAPIDLVGDLTAAVDSSLDLVTTSALLIVCHPIPGSNGS